MPPRPDKAVRKVRRGRGGQHLPALAADKLAALQQPINDAVRPCLVEIAALTQRERMPPPDVTFEHTRRLLARARANLEALALPPEDVHDIHYALVAYIDEVMQLHGGPLEAFWQAHLLQLEHYGETTAGEGFFLRLEELKHSGRLPVLRVYYLCLLLGFHGIYAHHGELERENLIDSVRQALGEHERQLPAEILSPFGPRPDEPDSDRQRNRLLQWCAGLSAGMALTWYIGTIFVIDAQERALLDLVSHAYEELRLGEAVGPVIGRSHE
jgi:type VI secretion system protein ImpK